MSSQAPDATEWLTLGMIALTAPEVTELSAPPERFPAADLSRSA